MPAPGDADPVDPTVASNSGAASYRIPIDVPPGPGGLAPKLALVYSSHAGDGPFGVGWRLHLGEIRCTTTQRGVPAFAACQPETPSATVRYELDGQLLTPGASAGRYHTFVESFREIRYLAASDSWVANSPDGTILRYGTTPESRIAAVGGLTARWLLSEIADPFQNRITVAYTNDPATSPDLPADVGMAYPETISYAAGDRSVHFVYEGRLDSLHDFAGGIERTITRRLKEIRVESYGELVHQLAFGYELSGVTYATGRSRLAWAQRVGSDGSTLPRQEFRYTDHGLTGGQWGADAPAWHLGNPNPRWPGFADLDAQLADVNGDGLPDKLRSGYWNGSTYRFSVELNTRNGWARSEEWSAALDATCCPSARLRVTLAIPDDAGPSQSLGVVEGSASVVVDPSEPPIGDVVATSEESPWWPMSGFLVTQGSWEALYASPGSNPTGEVFVSGGGSLLEAPAGSFRVVDLDADGLADLVYSFFLSGITEN